MSSSLPFIIKDILPHDNIDTDVMLHQILLQLQKSLVIQSFQEFKGRSTMVIPGQNINQIEFQIRHIIQDEQKTNREFDKQEWDKKGSKETNPLYS